MQEKQDLAERVMITRLHLYGQWIKVNPDEWSLNNITCAIELSAKIFAFDDQKCDHAKMYERISQENLELMRERLKETVIWPSDDTNTEKIGWTDTDLDVTTP